MTDRLNEGETLLSCLEVAFECCPAFDDDPDARLSDVEHDLVTDDLTYYRTAEVHGVRYRVTVDRLGEVEPKFGPAFEAWRRTGRRVDDVRDIPGYPCYTASGLYVDDHPERIPGWVYEPGWFVECDATYLDGSYEHRHDVGSYHVFLGSPVFDLIVPTRGEAERLLWEHHVRGEAARHV